MKFLISLLCFFFVVQTASADSCKAFLATDGYNESLSVTDNFIAYMHTLLETNMIQPSYLQNPLINPFNSPKTTTEQAFHKETIQSYLDSNELDKNKIEKWAKSLFSKQNKVDQEKKQASNETKAAIIKARFHNIPSGQFVFTKDFKTTVHIEVKEPFQLMETLVTEWMWREVNKSVGVNKWYVPTTTTEITFEELSHPMQFISVEQIDLFIADLNKLSQSKDPQIQIALQEIISEHKPGDIYDLPTFDEMAWVMTNLGLYKDNEFFDRNDDSEISKYAWTAINSSRKIHPVADLAPRVVNGHAFYDLEGNVWKVLKDSFAKLLDKFNFYQEKSDVRAIIGGGYLSGDIASGGMKVFSSKHFSHMPLDHTRTDVGFRLVRRPKTN